MQMITEDAVHELINNDETLRLVRHRDSLLQVIKFIAQDQQARVDISLVRGAVRDLGSVAGGDNLETVLRAANVKRAKVSDKSAIYYGPLVYFDGELWGVIQKVLEGEYVVYSFNAETGRLAEAILSDLPFHLDLFALNLTGQRVKFSGFAVPAIVSMLFTFKARLFTILLASLAISVMSLIASFFAIQVFDRVVPYQAVNTLNALAAGVAAVYLFDYLIKIARSRLMEETSNAMDANLAGMVYGRLLGVSLEDFPDKVGTLAQRVRSYESVKSFVSGVIFGYVFDLPILFVLLGFIALVAGKLVFIPVGFMALASVLMVFRARQIFELAGKALPSHNLKSGLLVETIEAAEVIKSTNDRWRMLRKWAAITEASRDLDFEIKELSDSSRYLLGLVQQFSYVLLIYLGVSQVFDGTMSLGGLFATSMLINRVFAPISALPGHILQWGQVKASANELDKLWALRQDGGSQDFSVRLLPEQNDFQLRDVTYSFGSDMVLSVPHLKINKGEKVAIIGTIGSGKSTLLRVMSGSYAPSTGYVNLGGIDMLKADRQDIADKITFVPQKPRLVAGNLRDNLLLGNKSYSDKELLEACQRSGVEQLVLRQNPKGLDRAIQEGGHGLSLGQSQLVHLTRVFLNNADVLILDEPTAALDISTETTIEKALCQLMEDKNQVTFVVATHKLSLLKLFDRLIVMGGGRVVLDGPRDEVLRKIGVVK